MAEGRPWSKPWLEAVTRLEAARQWKAMNEGHG
jgi:hypothetical protein